MNGDPYNTADDLPCWYDEAATIHLDAWTRLARPPLPKEDDWVPGTAPPPELVNRICEAIADRVAEQILRQLTEKGGFLEAFKTGDTGGPLEPR